MPEPSRSLTVHQAVELAATAFDGRPGDLVGIEMEWSVHPAHRRRARPSVSDLTPVLAMDTPAGGSISIEPGGQIELSTAAHRDAATAVDALQSDASALHTRLRENGLCPTVLAFDDRRPPRRILDRPRYAAMEAFFAHRGDAGTQMMTNTASVQINISHAPGGGHHRWEVANRIGPLLVAAFANSSGVSRAGRRWRSRRQETWSRIDPARTAPVPKSCSPQHAWAHYALNADVFFVDVRPAGIALAPGLKFGSWIADGHAIGWPTAEDLAYHLTTLFPPIRPRGWLELRMLDAVAPAATAAAAHIICAAMSAPVAADLLDRLPETRNLWHTAARDGLNNPTVRAGAQTLVETAEYYLQQTAGFAAAADTVSAFADRYTRRGLAPADDPSMHDSCCSQHLLEDAVHAGSLWRVP